MIWILLGFTLFLFLLCLVEVKVVLKVILSPETKGVFVEVILPRKLWKREYDLTHFHTDVTEGNLLLGWWQEKENRRGIPIQDDRTALAWRDVRELIRHGKRYFAELKSHRLLRRLFSWLRIRHLEWTTVVGLEDAMETALLTGALWGIKGGLMSFISNHIGMQRICLKVIPAFGEGVWESKLYCLVTVRPVHIIIAGFYARRIASGLRN